MELARKVTPAFFINGISLNSISKEVYLGRVYGIANKLVRFNTQFGENEKLQGEFVGVRSKDKESCTSGTCILPKSATDIIGKVLAQHKAVRFGFDVYASPSKETVYSWKLVSLMDLEPVSSALSFSEKFEAMPEFNLNQTEDGSQAAEPARRDRKPRQA